MRREGALGPFALCAVQPDHNGAHSPRSIQMCGLFPFYRVVFGAAKSRADARAGRKDEDCLLATPVRARLLLGVKSVV